MQYKMTIHEILDRLNEEVGYEGLENTYKVQVENSNVIVEKDKITDERDDVISRQAFNNWVRDYNRVHEIPHQIKSHKSNQFKFFYFESDVEKIIKVYKRRLEKAYKQKTVSLDDYQKSLAKIFGLKKVIGHEKQADRNNRIAKTKLGIDSMSRITDEKVKKILEKEKGRIVDLLLNMDQVEEIAIQSLIGGNGILLKDIQEKCIKKSHTD